MMEAPFIVGKIFLNIRGKKFTFLAQKFVKFRSFLLFITFKAMAAM